MEWSRDHRVHHKYSDTNADPYNINRGFFFSHIGWLMVKKHPELLEKGRGIDLSDLYADKVVMFQKRHYPKLVLFISFFLPTIIPMLFWGETLSNAWHVSTILRIVVNLNAAFVINSFAHMYGQKPYEKAIAPAENLAMAIFSLGEGWHNFHHVFPWDYKASELGKYSTNVTTAFIDFFAKIGWAYDLKTVTPGLIAARAKRTGDGTHVWGWDDKEMNEKDKRRAVIINPAKPDQIDN
uniref:Acyl-CoA Delta(11) desaturase n=3 Tax=Cacopsylla melanoneura TaxID=428564 RepID=A0A8D9F323_9HEMI